MPRIFTSETTLQADPFMEGLASGRAHADAQRELELQAERIGSYSRNVAMAEEAHALEMQAFQQQQEQQAAAQEYGVLQAQFGDERARAMVEGGMPESEDELAVFARLDPETQEFWREDKRRRVAQAKVDAKMRRGMQSAQVMAQMLPDGGQKHLELLASATSPEAFDEQMRLLGDDYSSAVETDQIAFINETIGTNIKAALADSDTEAYEFFIQQQRALIEGELKPMEVAAGLKAWDPEVTKQLTAIVGDRKLARVAQQAIAQAEVEGARAEASGQGSMPPSDGALSGSSNSSQAPLPEPPRGGRRARHLKKDELADLKAAEADIRAAAKRGEIGPEEATAAMYQVLEALELSVEEGQKALKRKDPARTDKNVPIEDFPASAIDDAFGPSSAPQPPKPRGPHPSLR